MTDTTKQEDGREQTIEDILTSIRQVITDDAYEAVRTKEKRDSDGRADEENPNNEARGILDLTELADDAYDPQKLTDAVRLENIETIVHNQLEKSMVSPGERRQALLSEHAADATTDKLSGLTGAVAAVRDIPLGNTQQSLEDLVKELLRPILKEWLDDNLPLLVERLVEKEIAKLVNRAEGD